MSGSAAPIPWRHLSHIVRKYLPVWAGATALFAVLGYGYTQVRTPKYSATQSLLVRNEANGVADRLGRFANQYDLKAAQETVLEMARSREVVSSSLAKLGPTPGSMPALTADRNWPRPADVLKATKRINVRPSKGSEFGATEVVYLETKATSTERASEFCTIVRENLTVALRKVRTERFAGVIQELTHARDLARKHRDEANSSLQKMESKVGSDLGDLRALTETFAGTGNSQRVLSEVRTEIQQAELALDALNELLTVLKRGQNDPDLVLVSGGELLTSQPTLKRLKDGFIDAQLAASSLSAQYTKNHPKMRAAEAAQLDILKKIRLEIAASIDSMAPQIRVATDRVKRLKAKRDNLSTRLDGLADIRTEYSNLVADFKHRTDLLEKAETALVEAEASGQASLSTDLLSPLGPVEVSSKPIGPNDTMLMGGSIAAGLLFGFGLVFLVAPGPYQDNFGRRWSVSVVTALWSPYLLL